MTCLLCGSDHQEVFTRVESFGYPLVYYHCEKCGLVFQSQEESQAADPDFYAATYRKIYQAHEEPTTKDLWVQAQRSQHLMDGLRKAGVNKIENMLDIGASAGLLLQAFKQAFGCQVTGVEPGEAYRSFAEQKGIRMFTSVDELGDSAPARFDLVSMSHVLEHLSDPVGMLRVIREKLLAENGLILLEVPNFYAHDSYELAHLVCYTPHTLKEALRQAGYEVVRFERHGVPRSDLLNLYLTVLARPASPQSDPGRVRPEKNVRLKRKLAMLYRRIVQKIFPHKAWLSLPEERGE
jgi:predicted TPR repeat methyltransferase